MQTSQKLKKFLYEDVEQEIKLINPNLLCKQLKYEIELLKLVKRSEFNEVTV